MATTSLPRSVLIVDDEPAFREMLGLMLEQGGYEVTHAADGVAGSRCLTQKAFDLVLTDMLMPERDGLEFITDIRRKSPGSRIVAMSGGGHISSDKYLKMARGLGAHVVLGKPFSREQLLEAVAAALETGTTPPMPPK
jgi:CheY-like chemotaxis protein